MEEYYLKFNNKLYEIKDLDSNIDYYDLFKFKMTEIIDTNKNDIIGNVFVIDDDNFFENKNYYFYLIHQNNLIDIKMTKNIIKKFNILNINYIDNKISIQCEKIDSIHEGGLYRPPSNLSELTESTSYEDQSLKESHTYADKIKMNIIQEYSPERIISPTSFLKTMGIEKKTVVKALNAVDRSTRNYKIELIHTFIDEIISKCNEHNIIDKVGSYTINIFPIINELLQINNGYKMFFSNNEESKTYWKKLDITHPIEQLEKEILKKLNLKCKISSTTIESNDEKRKYHVKDIFIYLYKDTFDNNNIKFYSRHFNVE
jgi:hypothetical protein